MPDDVLVSDLMAVAPASRDVAWLKRALQDWPGLEHLFREELAECNREAVANAMRDLPDVTRKGGILHDFALP